MRHVWFEDYPIGRLGIGEENDKIVFILFADQECPDQCELTRTSVIDQAIAQLNEYFEGKRKQFDLPLDMPGTEFQRSVWAALQTIPYGETFSYKEVAAKIGKPKATRAVGMANRHNPIPIVVPCHRVVGSDGSLTGFGGGLPVKRFLLDHEKRFSQNMLL